MMITDHHQVADLLNPPSIPQTQEFVLHHLNTLLPQLSQASPDGATSLLPSASVLRAHIEKVRKAQQASRQRTVFAQAELRKQLVSSLKGVKALKERLDKLPDKIADTEDELLQLCEDLIGRQSPNPESSRDGPTTIMRRLEQLHQAIDKLKQAKSYFTILAKAEHLRLETIKLDSGDIASYAAALDHLGQLSNLVRQCERLSGDTATSQLKAIGFLRAQRDAAFSALRDSRVSKLQATLASNNWPPVFTASPADRDTDDFSGDEGTESGDGSFARTDSVRKAWSDVCQLQDKAEKLGLMPRATAKPHKGGRHAPRPSERVAAGSDEYVPLLATQALIDPLLLRFRYHFDGERATNRLDKPEWYLSHIAALVRSQAQTFMPAIHGVPGSGGAAARLFRYYSNSKPDDHVRKAYRYIDTYAELLHGLITPLRRKLSSSIPSLLEHPSLLAHTVFQALTFDVDLRDQFPASLSVLDSAGTVKIADDILGNQEWFTKWLQGEKEFALRRFESVMDSPDAWAIGSSDSIAEDDDQVFSILSNAGQDLPDGALKTTKSARAVVEILESVTERYRPLPSLSQRLSFLAIVQLPILRAYQQRLQKSLDAFESLSSAFARVMPGEISAGIGAAAGVSTGSSDSDMVRGLHGLGKLIKAMLSALYICEELERWAETAFFVEMSENLASTEEGKKLALVLEKDDEDAQDRELDAASLGMLLRRGLKRGAAGVRPLTSNAGNEATSTPTEKVDGDQQLLNEFGRFGVWEEPRRKFGEVVARATTGVERLVVSEVLEQLRPYARRSWDEGQTSTREKDEVEGWGLDEDDQAPSEQDIPTPSLIASLSLLSTHLSHLVSILDPTRSIPIYRHIAFNISSAVIERVLMAGGSHRFDQQGAQRFYKDVNQGWLGVVREIATSKPGGFGRCPEAPWKSLRDAATILSLPSASAEGWTLAKASRWAFDSDDRKKYETMLEQLGEVDEKMVNVREVLRRRIECWK